MADTQAIKLASAADPRSFLVRCYGFERQAAAQEYMAGANFFKENGIFGSQDVYAPVHRERNWYVIRSGVHHGTWTSSLVAREPCFAFAKPTWEVIRDKGTAKPAGAYHVALMVEGPRRFYRDHRRTTKHPKWWYRISNGERDCFSAWAGKDGGRLGRLLDVSKSTALFAARAGRGVIYAREKVFDNSGKPAGMRTSLVRVEFSILDRRPDKDDLLKVAVFHQGCRSLDANKSEEPNLDGLDASWCQLVERARCGFETWCRTVPEDDDLWRLRFLDQRAKAEADRKDYSGQSFRDRVAVMDWQEALALVQEPWQLQAVIETHADSRFDATTGRFDTDASRVGRMLAQHGCTPERKQALRSMIDEFVEPANNLWNYTGD